MNGQTRASTTTTPTDHESSPFVRGCRFGDTGHGCVDADWLRSYRFIVEQRDGQSVDWNVVADGIRADDCSAAFSHANDSSPHIDGLRSDSFGQWQSVSHADNCNADAHRLRSDDNGCRSSERYADNCNADIVRLCPDSDGNGFSIGNADNGYSDAVWICSDSYVNGERFGDADNCNADADGIRSGDNINSPTERRMDITASGSVLGSIIEGMNQ